MTSVDLYLGLSEITDDADVVNLISQSGGVTKAKIALPYMIRHKTEVRKILMLCLETPQAELKDQLRMNFSLVPRNGKSARPVEPEQPTTVIEETASDPKVDRQRANRVVSFLAAEPHPVLGVGDEPMFVPRQHSHGVAIEWARNHIVEVYQEQHPDLTMDDIYDAQFRAWLSSISSDERRTLMTTAFERWKVSVKPMGGDEDDWPYGIPNEDQKTAA